MVDFGSTVGLACGTPVRPPTAVATDTVAGVATVVVHTGDGPVLYLTGMPRRPGGGGVGVEHLLMRLEQSLAPLAEIVPMSDGRIRRSLRYL